MCLKEGTACIPKVDEEFVKRTRSLQNDVLEGVFEHVDLAAYNLNAHAIKTHKKKLFKSQDMRDVKQRVQIMWPRCTNLPEMRVVDFLPQYCLDFMKTFPSGAWKVEWMFNGGFDYQMNDLYRLRYQKFSKNQERGVYSKLWDGIGFSKYDLGYKMWLETLSRPGKVIRYEGNAYWISEQKVVPQVARMLTHVYDYDHLVTITVVTP